MKKQVIQAACLTLPFATAMVGFVVTPGYGMAGHATTLSIATLVSLAALFAVSLNMPSDEDSDISMPVVAGWVLTAAIFLVTMMETVILRPGGVEDRHWLPSIALFAIAIVCLCERDGDAADRDMLRSAASKGALAIGAVLTGSLVVSATASRLSGDNAATLLISFLFLPLVFAAFIQNARQDEPARSRLGTAALLMLFMVIVTAEGTYEWSPHYGTDPMSRSIFQ